MRRFAGLSALLVAEMGALAVLIGLGRSPAFAIPLDRLGWWLQATPPGDVFAALARFVGLAVATWMLASTIVYVVAAASGAGGALRLAAAVTPAMVRRIADRALAATIVVSAAAGLTSVPAGAATRAREPSATTSPVRDGRTSSSAPRSATPPSVVLPPEPRHIPVASIPSDRRALPTTSVPPPAPPAVTLPPLHVVADGECLWSIAVATLSAAHGARPSPAEVIPYWHALIALNRSRLRSGDPNLIYAGEVLLLPEL